MTNRDRMKWLVYSPNSPLAVARFVEPEDAAAFVAILGDGASVERGGRPVFVQGRDGDAAESYDAAAAVMLARAETGRY